MLLYIENSSFVIHTFVVQCSSSDTLARVRARLLHILYGMGKESHQFRLRFKGQFLRDSYSLDDYRIGNRSILKMVPMSKQQESLLKIEESMGSAKWDSGGGSQSEEIRRALLREVVLLKWRETLLRDFKGSLFVSWLFVLFAFFTTYWYSGIWNGVITMYGVLRCPTYSHRSGFVGTSSLWPGRFMLQFAVITLLNWCGAVTLVILCFLPILHFDCTDGEESIDNSCGNSYIGLVYSLGFFVFQAIYLFGVCSAAFTLMKNFGFHVGDYLEKFLVITRDVEKVILAAKSNRIKEQRTAAFELATLATTGDDSKFRIVAEGGLEVLISLGLSTDESTQEYATEAMAELLTVPAIQDQFVEAGGVTTLSTVLRSRNERLVQEATTALSYIVSDSDENKRVVAAERGLEDLAYAAQRGTDGTRRCIAGILLDLAFSPEIRSRMASMDSPTSALVALCNNEDTETLRLSLQTLELIAIESPDVILYHEELLEHLLNITRRTLDVSIYLLAGKILLYFAEYPELCHRVLSRENLKDTLMRFVKTGDATLQKVVCKVIHCILEEKTMILKAKELGLKDVLLYVSQHAGDRDAWNMADEGVTFLVGSGQSKFVPSTSSSSDSLESSSLGKLKESSLDSLEGKKMGSLASLSKEGPSGGTGPMTGSVGSIQKMGSQSSLSLRGS